MSGALTRRAMLGGALALPALARAATSAPEVRTLTAKGGRAVAVSLWKARGRRRGVILFSHGALSSPSKYPAMVDRWMAAGYDIHAPLHVDSLEHPHRADFPGLTGWAARIEDMRATSAAIGSDYMAVGHSYGALTALVMGGAEAVIPPGVEGPLRDPRALGSLAFSPPGPMPPLIDAKGYAALAVPALITTGTRDLLPNQTDPESWHAHLAAYEAAAPGHDRYAAIIEGADHYFGGQICDFSKTGPPQSRQLDVAIALSLLFLKSSFSGTPHMGSAPLLASLKGRPGVDILAK